MCTETKKIPHKHAAIIKAWAEGETIECRSEQSPEWKKIKEPMWYECVDYRVAPSIVTCRVALVLNKYSYGWRCEPILILNTQQEFHYLSQGRFIRWLTEPIPYSEKG